MAIMRAVRGNVFSEAERSRMLERFKAAWLRKEAAEDDDDEEETDAARREMAAIARDYEDAVPIVAFSRCPFTTDIYYTSLDLFGLDGLWWAYEYDYRPYVEPIRTFFAWTGALKLDGPIPEWSLKAMVGPEAPFVLARILQHPDIKAVVSSVLIGEHIGFPIVYYASPAVHGLERVDDWGHAFHSFLRPDGSPTSAHSVESDGDKDFDLRPWLDSGKLAWIEPGDATLRLRNGRAGCPYLDLPGERRRRYIQEGDTWFATM